MEITKTKIDHGLSYVVTFFTHILPHIETSRGNKSITSSVQDKKADETAPLQASTGPEGSRKLRLPYFMTIGTRRW